MRFTLTPFGFRPPLSQLRRSQVRLAPFSLSFGRSSIAFHPNLFAIKMLVSSPSPLCAQSESSSGRKVSRGSRSFGVVKKFQGSTSHSGHRGVAIRGKHKPSTSRMYRYVHRGGRKTVSVVASLTLNQGEPACSKGRLGAYRSSTTMNVQQHETLGRRKLRVRRGFG